MKQMRRAVIDVGTNSIKLLVGDVADGIVTPVEERSEQTRLGAGFYEDHMLQAVPITRTKVRLGSVTANSPFASTDFTAATMSSDGAP